MSIPFLTEFYTVHLFFKEKTFNFDHAKTIHGRVESD